MGRKHLNPLEKEFLIRQYKSNPRLKMWDFCETNSISAGAFQRLIKQYDEGGLEGLVRADSEIKEVLLEGIDRTEETYKREILKLRIEKERLKKTMPCRRRIPGNRSTETPSRSACWARNRSSYRSVKNTKKDMEPYHRHPVLLIQTRPGAQPPANTRLFRVCRVYVYF